MIIRQYRPEGPYYDESVRAVCISIYERYIFQEDRFNSSGRDAFENFEHVFPAYGCLNINQ